MQKIARMVESNLERQIQVLEDLKVQKKVVEGDELKLIEIEQKRRDAEAEIDREKQKIRGKLVKQIEAQELMNASLMNSIKDRNKKVLDDSNKGMRSFLEEMKEKMRKTMEGKFKPTSVDGLNDGSSLMGMVYEQQQELAGRYGTTSGNFGFIPVVSKTNDSVARLLIG